MTEQELYQMAYKWSIHVWYEAELELRKHTDNKYLKEEEQEAWEDVKAIEKMAEEKGYTV